MPDTSIKDPLAALDALITLSKAQKKEKDQSQEQKQLKAFVDELERSRRIIEADYERLSTCKEVIEGAQRKLGALERLEQDDKATREGIEALQASYNSPSSETIKLAELTKLLAAMNAHYQHITTELATIKYFSRGAVLYNGTTAVPDWILHILPYASPSRGKTWTTSQFNHEVVQGFKEKLRSLMGTTNAPSTQPRTQSYTAASRLTGASLDTENQTKGGQLTSRANAIKARITRINHETPITALEGKINDLNVIIGKCNSSRKEDTRDTCFRVEQGTLVKYNHGKSHRKEFSVELSQFYFSITKQGGLLDKSMDLLGANRSAPVVYREIAKEIERELDLLENWLDFYDRLNQCKATLQGESETEERLARSLDALLDDAIQCYSTCITAKGCISLEGERFFFDTTPPIPMDGQRLLARCIRRYAEINPEVTTKQSWSMPSLHEKFAQGLERELEGIEGFIPLKAVATAYLERLQEEERAQKGIERERQQAALAAQKEERRPEIQKDINSARQQLGLGSETYCIDELAQTIVTLQEGHHARKTELDDEVERYTKEAWNGIKITAKWSTLFHGFVDNVAILFSNLALAYLKLGTRAIERYELFDMIGLANNPCLFFPNSRRLALQIQNGHAINAKQEPQGAPATAPETSSVWTAEHADEETGPDDTGLANLG